MFLILFVKLLIIRENKIKEVLCVVNSNVVLVLMINWYLELIDIIIMVGINKIYIVIIGDRLNNMKIL